MKTRIFVVTVACAVAGLLGWFLNPPATETVDKTAAAKAPAVDTPKPAAKPASIKPPKPARTAQVATPAPKSAAVPASKPAAPEIDLSNPQPQADLKDCIAQTIKILEARDVLGLIRTLMPPDALQEMLASGQFTSVEDFAAQFSQRPNMDQKMTEMLQALESVKDQAPELSADGTQATYKNADATGGGRDLVFIQVNGFWYLD